MNCFDITVVAGADVVAAHSVDDFLEDHYDCRDARRLCLCAEICACERALAFKVLRCFGDLRS